MQALLNEEYLLYVDSWNGASQGKHFYAPHVFTNAAESEHKFHNHVDAIAGASYLIRKYDCKEVIIKGHNEWGEPIETKVHAEDLVIPTN